MREHTHTFPHALRLQAMSKRNASTTLLRGLARELTEELGYASTSRRASRLEQWRQGTPLTPLR